MPHSVIKAVTLVFLASAASGCSLFRARPFLVPENLQATPGMAAIAAGETTAENYGLAFPEIENCRMSSRVLARYRRIFGKIYLDLSVISKGLYSLRMIGRFPANQLVAFDLLVRGREMSVYVPQDSSFYRGPIPETGSPFRVRFGVEPNDLVAIALIGRRLATGELTTKANSKSRVFIPGEGIEITDGLVRLETDAKTGLPRRAFYEKQGFKLQVQYQAWELFSLGDGAAGGQSPMPTRFTIERNRPRATIEVMTRPRGEEEGGGQGSYDRQYLLNHPNVTERQFELTPPPRGTRLGTLDDLDRILSGR